jgi:MoxR-like ATPase
MLAVFSLERLGKTQLFDSIVGYEGIKRTFLRSLNSADPVHILLVGAPGQAKTLFLKCILEAYGPTKAFFTVGGNASKSGMIDVLFEMRPKYLLVDEIEHLKPEYQTLLLSLMETGILTQTVHKKVRETKLKTWVFATSNGTKKLSEPLLSRFRVMYLDQYDFAQFYEISTKKLTAEGLSEYAADEITKSVWEQLPNPNIRNCVLIGRLVKNEQNIEMAIAEEIQNFRTRRVNDDEDTDNSPSLEASSRPDQSIKVSKKLEYEFSRYAQSYPIKCTGIEKGQ